MRRSSLAAVIVIVAALVRLALAAVIPLFPDETYYWDWSRHLAAGYFDHPGGIAVLIRAGTVVFGATSLGVRAGVVLAGAIASWALVVLTRDLETPDLVDAGAADGNTAFDSPAVSTAILTSVIPVALVGFVLATPDAPLLATIAVALVALTRAIAAPPRSRQTLGWWIAAGVMLGLGFSSKYTSVLLPLGVFVALLTRGSLRRRLAEPGPYVATIVALLVFAPTIIWNARHEWVSFAFQLHHGLGTPHGSPISRELDLVGGQLGLVTPILAILAVIAVARSLRRIADDRRYLLAVVATVVVAFFAISALRKPVEANWPAPALVASIPLLALQGPHPSKRWRMWYRAALALAAVISLVAVVDAVGHVLPLSARRDPVSRAEGWSDLAAGVERARRSLPPACSATWIAADRYQDASELAFHLPAQPRVFALNIGGRPNQYDLWPQLASLAAPSDCVLFVVDNGARGATTVQQVHADRAVPLGTIDMRWGRDVVAQRAVWLLQGIPSTAEGTAFAPSAAVRAAIDTLAVALPTRSAVLDSVAALFRHGPAPYLVAATDSGPAVSNSDRRVAIARRVTQLHPLLARAGADAVYRDARYPDCTFIRTGTRAGTAVGYVLAAERCSLLRSPRDDRIWSVRPAPLPSAPTPDSSSSHTGRRPTTPATWLLFAAR